MKEQGMNTNAAELEKALERAGRALNRWSAEVRVLFGAAAVLACLFAVGLADLLVGFGRFARILSWLLLTAAFVFAVFRVVSALRRKRTIEGVAARIEKAFPELDNRLINCVQFARDARPDELSRAYVAQGVPRWRDLKLDAMRDGNARLKALASVGAAAIALAAPFLATGPAWPVALWRVVNPFSNCRPVSLTRIISVEPGDTSVLQAKSLTLACKVQGVKRHGVWLDIAPADGDRVTQFLGRIGSGGVVSFTWEIEAVNTDMKYRFRAGDHPQPQWFTVKVRPPLAFVKMGVTVTPPAYTHLRPRTFDGMTETVEIPEMSSVAIAMACNLPLASATAVAKSGSRAALTAGADAVEWRCEGLTNAADIARLVAVNAYGDTAEADLNAVLMSDKAPSIGIVAPKGRGFLAPGAKPAIEFKVDDDYGLTDVRVESVAPEGGDKTAAEAVGQWPVAMKRTFAAAWRAESAARTNRTVAFRIVAEDNCPFGKHIVRSAPISFDAASVERAAMRSASDRVEVAALLDRLIEMQKANLSYTRGLCGAVNAAEKKQWTVAAGRQKEVRNVAGELLKNSGESLGSMAPVMERLYMGEMLDAIAKLDRVPLVAAAEKGPLALRCVVLEETILRKLSAVDIAAESIAHRREIGGLLSMLEGLVRGEMEVIAATTQCVGNATAVRRDMVEKQDGLADDMSEFVKLCRTEAVSLQTQDTNFAALVVHVADTCESAKVKEDMLRAAESLEKNDPAAALPVEQRCLSTLGKLWQLMNKWQAVEAAKQTAEMAEALHEAGDRLAKIEKLTSSLIEAMRMVEVQKDRSDAKKDKLEEEIEELKTNIKDALLQIPKDLHIYPELSVANELVEDVYSVFEEVTQVKGSEQMTAADAQEMGVLKPEELLEQMKKAEGRIDEMEMWLAEKPDAVKFNQEAFDREEMPKLALGALPTALEDLIGDLLKEQPDLAEAADDSGTNIAMPEPPPPGWEVAEGPIESFGAQGKSGNQAPDHKEQSGRSLVGRQGQAIGETAAGSGTINEGDKNIEKRITPEPLQSGQVQADGKADTVATGGGKQGSGSADGQGMAGAGANRRMDSAAKGSVKGLESLMARTEALQVKASLLNMRTESLEDAAHHMRQANDAIAAGLPIRQVREHRRDALGALKQARTELDSGVSGSLGRGRGNAPVEDAVENAAENAPAAYRDMVGEYFKSLSGSL